MEKLITFQTYASIEEANEVAERLQQQRIVTEVVKIAPKFPDVILGSNYDDNYLLKIPASNFTKAYGILYSSIPIDATLVDDDHPLCSMGNDELRDVIAKPDEWGADNYRVALALLNDRGITITDGQFDQFKEERTRLLAQKKSLHPALIFLGYFMGFLPFTIYGMYVAGISSVGFAGFFWDFLWALGIIIGFVTVGSKTTLPDGTRIHTYNKTTIMHGKAIIVVYLISMIAIFIFGIRSI